MHSLMTNGRKVLLVCIVGGLAGGLLGAMLFGTIQAAGVAAICCVSGLVVGWAVGGGMAEREANRRTWLMMDQASNVPGELARMMAGRDLGVDADQPELIACDVPNAPQGASVYRWGWVYMSVIPTSNLLLLRAAGGPREGNCVAYKLPDDTYRIEGDLRAKIGRWLDYITGSDIEGWSSTVFVGNESFEHLTIDYHTT